MNEPIFLEILGRDRRVVARYAWTDGVEITIGSQRDDTVVLDSLFASPRHVSCSRRTDENGQIRIVVRDNGSLNGLYRVGRRRSRIEEADLAAGEMVELARHLIRWVPASFAEAPIPDWETKRWVRLLNQPLLFGLVVLLSHRYAYIDALWTTGAQLDWQEYLVSWFGAIGGSLAWAAIFGVVSRRSSGQSYFFAHANIALLALLAMDAGVYAYEPVLFALDIDHLGTAIALAFGAVTMALSLGATLRLIETRSDKQIAIRAIVASILLTALSYTNIRIQDLVRGPALAVSFDRVSLRSRSSQALVDDLRDKLNIPVEETQQ